MDRGRGRARGRARGSEPQQQRQPQQQRPGGGGRPGGPAQGPPPGGASSVPPVVQTTPAWGPRTQVQQQHQLRAPAPQPQVVQAGRATYRGGGQGDAGAPGAEASHTSVVTGPGDVASMHSGRGAVRGRRPLHEGVLRTRPAQLATKLGNYGQPVRLSANYFQLLQTTNWGLRQYRVDFSPEEDRTSLKKFLLRTAIKDILAGYIFDGTVLYAAQRLDPDPMELFAQPEGQETNYRITIRGVGEVLAGDYQYLQFFNIIIRKCMNYLKLQLVGRNFFDAVARVSIPEHKLELWPGYLTSIRQHENAILMCCEITHKVMRMDTVLHLLQDCIQEDRAKYKAIFHQRIVGSIVLTDYNNRTYRIDDVDFNTTPESKFSKKDGTSISYVQYYRERYNIAVREVQQPMLVSRAKAREIRAGMPETVYLIPELCRMTGLTDAQRANFNLMRSLADHTRVGPGPRIEKLMNFNRRLLRQPEIVEELKKWDLKLATSLVEFSGRVLPAEDVFGQGNNKYSAGKDADWTRELRSRPLLHAESMNMWVVICPTRCKNSAFSFVQMLQKAATGMSWKLPMPKLHEIKDDRPGTYMEGLEAVIHTHNPNLILCVVTNNKADRYSAIKKKCCVDKAVPTQVILAKNLDSKGAMSIATKVAIQMNCKIGGAPWTVHIPFKTMMVVGFDVCHDTNQKGKSFGALCATLDPFCSRYFSVVTAHTNDEELSNDIALNIIKACKEWQRIHKRLPEKILIYRDAVGDGQLPYVYQYELQNIIKKLKAQLYQEQELKIGFIVVSKRINTRIFAGGNNNPPPGTVVDDCITLPERYDFFIVSQCVRQGTVSPTSYNVLYENLGNTADQLQRMTYKLTHMYYNWSGTVRVPAPCQYAHKLAFLTAQSLHRTPNPELDKVLYYL